MKKKTAWFLTALLGVAFVLGIASTSYASSGDPDSGIGTLTNTSGSGPQRISHGQLYALYDDTNKH